MNITITHILVSRVWHGTLVEMKYAMQSAEDSRIPPEGDRNDFGIIIFYLLSFMFCLCLMVTLGNCCTFNNKLRPFRKRYSYRRICCNDTTLVLHKARPVYVPRLVAVGRQRALRIADGDCQQASIHAGPLVWVGVCW